MARQKKKIVIVGGGFGGIRCALDLAKKNLKDAKIVLISDKPHFEYHASLYRVVTGRSPLEVCVPLFEIFGGKNVEIVEDLIIDADLKNKIIKGESGSRYSFDFLVLALGSETAYFDIPGMEALCFSFKSIKDALALKRHIHNMFEACKAGGVVRGVCALHIVVVGGGASGTELAGELALYAKKLARKHKIDPSLPTIDIVEASRRLLPGLPPDISETVKKRLHSLGVNVFLNRSIVKKEIEDVYLKDMIMKTKTVVWAAGVRPNFLFSKIQGLFPDKSGRVIVDEHLQAEGRENVFIVGDGAATVFSGMAQTALADGKYAADAIRRKIKGKNVPVYRPKRPSYAVPAGSGWAAVLFGSLRLYGRAGWMVRRLADLRFFLSILPFGKALTAFRAGKELAESCPVCVEELKRK